MTGTTGLKNLQVDCIIGIYPHERAATQTVYLDIELDYDFAAHGRVHRDASVAHAQFHHRSAGGEIGLDVERMVGVGGAGGGRPDAVDVGEALVFQGAHYRC